MGGAGGTYRLRQLGAVPRDPMDGSSQGSRVGPPEADCTSAHGPPTANGSTSHRRPEDSFTSGGSVFQTGNPSNLPPG